jgi:hypothetical protein
MDPRIAREQTHKESCQHRLPRQDWNAIWDVAASETLEIDDALRLNLSLGRLVADQERCSQYWPWHHGRSKKSSALSSWRDPFLPGDDFATARSPPDQVAVSRDPCPTGITSQTIGR